jgi:flagellar biosynthetic protein FliP
MPSASGQRGIPRKLSWLLLPVAALPTLATGATTAANRSLNLSLDGAAGGEQLSQALQIVLLLTLLTLIPAVVIAMTSFTRTIIVLSMLRHAFGMQDTPPNMVLVSLALFLTLFTMSPAISDIYGNSVRPYLDHQLTVDVALEKGIAPLRAFMIRQTREKDLALILEVAHEPVPDAIDQVRTIHIIPAFLLSELKTAFQIGFVVFLPFLLLDLVVSSILMAMGMIMVPPTIISLPIKLLMFVIIDGWGLVIRALLGSFH